MQAEIVVIGTELLLGQIIDTNAAYLAQQLSSIGIDLYYKSAVGDNKGRIVETLKMASERSELVLTTGGIGPTLDDMTRESVAEVQIGRASCRERVESRGGAGRLNKKKRR